MACSEAPVDSEIRADDELPNVESADDLGRYVVGTWTFNSLEVAFLDDDGNFITVPSTVYPEQMTSVPYTDGSGYLDIQFEGGVTFYDDGTLANYRRITSSTGELDQEKVVWGEWEPMSERVQMDTEEFFVRAYVTALRSDDMFLDWDREDPEFEDDSCIFSIDLSRTVESEINWIGSE